jgi:hypothetical protein
LYDGHREVDSDPVKELSTEELWKTHAKILIAFEAICYHELEALKKGREQAKEVEDRVKQTGTTKSRLETRIEKSAQQSKDARNNLLYPSEKKEDPNKDPPLMKFAKGFAQVIGVNEMLFGKSPDKTDETEESYTERMNRLQTVEEQKKNPEFGGY